MRKQKRAIETLKNLRKKLDKINAELVDLIAKRQRIVVRVGKIKKKLGLPIVDKKREREIFKTIEALAARREVNVGLAKKIIKLLIEDAKRIQKSL
jgi:chorismate mutase